MSEIKTLDLSQAPLPTDKTIRARINPFAQIVRFVLLNLKMMKIIAKGHKSD